MQYFVLTWNRELEDIAVLSSPPAEIANRTSRFNEGVSLKEWFPSPAAYPMDPEFPRARRLYDVQANTLGLLIASKELKTTLDQAGCDNIEHLPISIINHRGKLASADYFIVNILHPVDAMDRERSRYENNPMIPSQVLTMKKLVLLDDRVPPNSHLFRLTNAPRFPLITETLKQILEKKKLTGMLFVPTEEFNTALY